jgi:hypothetical protein
MCLATAASVRLAFVASNVPFGARRLALQDYFFVKRSWDAHLRIVSGRSVHEPAHICTGPSPHLRSTQPTSAQDLTHICAGSDPHLRRTSFQD